MRAIDTNIVVRLCALDDDHQVAVAAALLAEPFIVVPTVFLEAEWVLRSSYKMPPARIAADLLAFSRNPNASVIAPEAVRSAIDALAAGADFADALHAFLALEAGASVFSTFDKDVETEIGTLLIPIETLS